MHFTASFAIGVLGGGTWWGRKADFRLLVSSFGLATLVAVVGCSLVCFLGGVEQSTVQRTVQKNALHYKLIPLK